MDDWKPKTTPVVRLQRPMFVHIRAMEKCEVRGARCEESIVKGKVKVKVVNLYSASRVHASNALGLVTN